MARSAVKGSIVRGRVTVSRSQPPYRVRNRIAAVGNAGRPIRIRVGGSAVQCVIRGRGCRPRFIRFSQQISHIVVAVGEPSTCCLSPRHKSTGRRRSRTFSGLLAASSRFSESYANVRTIRLVHPVGSVKHIVGVSRREIQIPPYRRESSITFHDRPSPHPKYAATDYPTRPLMLLPGPLYCHCFAAAVSILLQSHAPQRIVGAHCQPIRHVGTGSIGIRDAVNSP